MSTLYAHGEAMERIMPGLYSGDDVRAERGIDGRWRFGMKGRAVAEDMPYAHAWVEHTPIGLWCHIGTWKTLKTGLWVASRLRAGTHFWDSRRDICRLYNEHVYAVIRGEADDEGG